MNKFKIKIIFGIVLVIALFIGSYFIIKQHGCSELTPWSKIWIEEGCW